MEPIHLLVLVAVIGLVLAATQTTGSLTNETKTFYDRTLLEAARPVLLHDQWAQKRPIPQREGQTVQFRRFEILSTKGTALVEGVTPSGDDLTVNTVTATPLQYGGYTVVSDVLDWTGIDPVLTEAAEIQGVQAGETLDELCRDVLQAGTTVRYANGRTTRATVASGDIVNGVELRKLRRTLRKNKAKPAVGKYFALVVSPDTLYDLQSMAEWVAVAEYQQAEKLETGEIGQIYQFKVYETEKAKIFAGAGASSIDVHSALAIGANAYGVVNIAGHALETIHKPLGSGGTEDPLDQRATSGWKATFVAVRLNENFLARLEHAVTG